MGILFCFVLTNRFGPELHIYTALPHSTHFTATSAQFLLCLFSTTIDYVSKLRYNDKDIKSKFQRGDFL